MKTLRFVPSDKGQFTATLRKNVNDYFREKGISTRGNVRMAFKAVTMLACYLVPFALMLFLPMSGWLIFPLFITMGIGMSGIGMGVMHDAVHGSLSKRSWVNRLFGSTMYLIGGSTFNWRIQHNVLHHTYTNIEGFDEDIEPKGSIRFSTNTPLKRIHRFQHIYAFFLYAFLTLARMASEFSRLRKYSRDGLVTLQGTSLRGAMTRLVITKAGYLLVFIGLPLIFSAFTWWMILVGFLIMHVVAGIIMSTVFQMAHLVEVAAQPAPEGDVIRNEWMIHELETTANFSMNSRLFGWMIGGLNYQIEHHLFPNICHIHYRALAPIVQRTAGEFGIRYNVNRTFFGAIRSHVRMLRALGRE
jgi:linoleoyl-CoA desaturase